MENLKINTWYISESGNFLVWNTGIEDNYTIHVPTLEENKTTYCLNVNICREATADQVFNILKKVAIKRGLWDVPLLNGCLASTYLIESHRKGGFAEYYNLTSYKLWSKYGCIWKYGVWLELPKTQITEECITTFPEKWYLRFKTEEVFNELCKTYRSNFKFYPKAGICNKNEWVELGCESNLTIGNYYYLDDSKTHGTEITYEQFKQFSKDLDSKKVSKLNEVVHCTSQEEWDFVESILSLKIYNWFADPKLGNKKSFCRSTINHYCSDFMESYIARGNCIILSFQEWCDKYNHTNPFIAENFILPKEWYFEVTEDNYKEVCKIRGSDGTLKIASDESFIGLFITSRPVFNLNWGYWVSKRPTIPKITFEQFKKYYLKIPVTTLNNQLHINKEEDDHSKSNNRNSEINYHLQGTNYTISGTSGIRRSRIDYPRTEEYSGGSNSYNEKRLIISY